MSDVECVESDANEKEENPHEESPKAAGHTSTTAFSQRPARQVALYGAL